jgi:hypothetical protein
VSRWIFSPRPNETVRQLGRQQGRLLREMVTEYLETEPATAFGPLTRQIVDALGAGQVTPANADLLGRTVAGIMLGFAPTVLGNLRTVLHRWVQTRTLWDVQAALRDSHSHSHGDNPPPSDHARTGAVLRPALTQALMARPTPEVVWRTVREDHTLQGVELREGDRLIVGIASATQADLAAGVRDEGTVFGGQRARHGCPGHAMGMGVLLGVIAALLDAGTLRATASPDTLRLTA